MQTTGISRSIEARLLPAVLTAILLLCLSAAAARAEDKKSKSLELFFGPTGGTVWYFIFDDDVEEFRMPPHWAYGAHIVKIWHFSWSRNMALEGTYLHSQGDGEVERLDGSTYSIDLTADQALLKVAYFFPQARISPYIAGGFGATYFRYQESDTDDKIKEWSFTMGAGAGMDIQLVKHWTIGPSVRVYQIFPKEIAQNWITGASIQVRTSAKF